MEGKSYIKIDVRNPRTHIADGKALFTDYEIVLQTNNIAFTLSYSRVRRRYSDFEWLRDRLQQLFGFNCNLPQLPPKLLFGRFKDQVLTYRKQELQSFLLSITSEVFYLSDLGLHLFLQSKLCVEEIEIKLNGCDSDDELNTLLSPYSSAKWLWNSAANIERFDSMSVETDSGNSLNLTYQRNSYLLTDNISELSGDTVNSKEHACKHHSCAHYATSQNSYSDSAYGSIYSNSCSRAEDNSLTSSDDFLHNELYDADDEVERAAHEKSDVANPSQEKNTKQIRQTDTDHLFSITQNNQGEKITAYTLDRAMEIIKERPKLTERLSFDEEDSDDCFRESDYDVIDTDEDLDILNISNSEYFFKMTTPVITIRSYSSGDEGMVEIIKCCKRKPKLGKVRSLPNIRFPLRKKEKVLRRVPLLLGSGDECKVCACSLPGSIKSKSSGSEDLSSSPELHTFPNMYMQRGATKAGVIKTKRLSCYDIFNKAVEIENSALEVGAKEEDSDTLKKDHLGRFRVNQIQENQLS